MAQCKYIIKLPSGEHIELLAGFSTVENTDQLEQEYAKYVDNGSPDQLIEILKKAVPAQLNNANTLKALINKSDNLNNLLVALNDRIEGLGDYSNIDDAIYKYVVKGKNNASGLVKKLKQPINAKYFQDFGVEGVIDMSSIAEEKKRVSINNAIKSAYGFEDVISSSLNTFMNALTKANADTDAVKENRTDMKLYGTNSDFIGMAWVTEDGVVVYKKDDDLSLFLGLFKREALKLPAEKLVPLIENLNKAVKFKKYGKIELPLDVGGNIDVSKININEFFNGVIKEGVIHESQFESLLKLGADKKISSEINDIIKAIATNIDAKNTRLNAALKNLFWSLNPEDYGKNKLQAQMQAQQYMEEELANEIEYKVSEAPIIDAAMQPLTRDQNYARSTTIVSEAEDLYDDVIKAVTPYRDIISFPISKGKTMYATPVLIQKWKNGTFVRAARIGQDGTMQYITHLFTDTITYRKMEEAIDPFIEGEVVEEVSKEDSVLLVSDEYFSQEVVKRFVRKGDLVNGKVVLGVYPGYIRLRNSSKGTYTDNFFQAITSIISKELKNELSVLEQANKKSLVPIRNSADITEGDFIQIPLKNGKVMEKRVILADKKNVWYTIPNPKSKGDFIVKSTPKEGLKGVKDVFGLITLEEITDIIRSPKLSTFVDPKKAREGDYVRVESEGNYIYGKVLNDNKVYMTAVENKKSKQVVDISTLENPTFYTNRDITENYTLFSIRANTNKIVVGGDEKNPLLERMYYAVPKGTDPKSIRNLSENLFNIGSFRNTVNTDTEEDFTDIILEMMGNDPESKVFAEFESSKSNRYVKHLPNMTEIKYFNNLTQIQKNELDVLQKGVYFSTFGERGIDFNIYRITEIDGDNVTARLYKIKDGKVVTTEKMFNKQVLLSDTLENGRNPIGKIAKLYMINGNRRMGAVMNAVKSFSNESPLKSAQAMAERLKSSIEGLPIEMEFVEPDGVFESNQKARITSDSDGIVKLQVNKDIGKKEDVVHEFLHIFLTPLRYKNPEIYNSLIQSVIKGADLDVTAAEERFVEVVSRRLVADKDVEGVFNGNTLQDFVNGLKTVLKGYEQDYTILEEDNPITLLNMSLADIFGIAEANISPLYNKSMISTEPLMREWMTNNNIKLKCN